MLLETKHDKKKQHSFESVHPQKKNLQNKELSMKLFLFQILFFLFLAVLINAYKCSFSVFAEKKIISKKQVLGSDSEKETKAIPNGP